MVKGSRPGVLERLAASYAFLADLWNCPGVTPTSRPPAPPAVKRVEFKDALRTAARRLQAYPPQPDARQDPIERKELAPVPGLDRIARSWLWLSHYLRLSDQS
jgi:hypothetical protein